MCTILLFTAISMPALSYRKITSLFSKNKSEESCYGTAFNILFGNAFR